MADFFVLEDDLLVRADVIDIVQASYPDLTIRVAETAASLAKDLSVLSAPSIVILSATRENLQAFFVENRPSVYHLFITIGDDNRSVLPAGYVILNVLRPFTHHSLLVGINSALSCLRSYR